MTDAETRDAVAGYVRQVRHGHLRESDLTNYGKWLDGKWVRHDATWRTLVQAARIMPYLRKYVTEGETP
jgi:hypothetical protein